MHSATLLALAAAGLVGQTVASPHYQGLLRDHQKRAYVTELVTVTDWITVTIYEGAANTDKKTHTHFNKPEAQTSSEVDTSSAPSPPPVVPTTIITQVAPTSAVPEQNSPPEVVDTPPPPPAVSFSTAQSESSPVPVPDPVPVPEGGQGNGDGKDRGNNGDSERTGKPKRGLSYNVASLLPRFLDAGSKVSWLYNWGQYDDSNTDLEFCPMLWGLKLDFAETWPGNAQKAVDAGSRCLLSFNEPDLEEQANMSPQLAAQKHIELMNPFSGKARIGSPAITNSVQPNQGIDWLQQWFSACGGRCAVDFVNIHIYGVDTDTFLSHLRDVKRVFDKPVWITEFGFGGSENQIDAQLATVIDQIENNATYSFVERYAYFMVEDGFMVKGNSLSTYGSTFAYGA